MALNPSALLRRASTDRIAAMLRGNSDEPRMRSLPYMGGTGPDGLTIGPPMQGGGLPYMGGGGASKDIAAMLRGQVAVNPNLRDPGGHASMPGAYRDWSGPSPTPVPNAGLFNTPAPLPTDSGDIDPPILVPPMEGPTPGGQQPGPIAGGSWPQGVLPGGQITSFGYNPVTGNAPPTDVPTFWGPSQAGYNPVTGNPLAVPFDTQVTSNGNASGGTTGGGPIGTLRVPNVVAAKSPGGHNANYWVF